MCSVLSKRHLRSPDFVSNVLLYGLLFVYIDRIGVLTSSARAGPEEGSRLTRWRLFGKISGAPPGAVTLLRRERAKQAGNGWDKAPSVMEEQHIHKRCCFPDIERIPNRMC